MKKLLTLLLSLLMILSLIGCNPKKEETSTHTHQYEVDEDGVWICAEDNEILSNTDKPYVALLENNEPKDIIPLDSIASKKTNLGNGVIYKDDNFDELYNKTKYLLDNKNKLSEIGINAYHTITESWGPDVAAKRLYEFVSEIKKGNKSPNLYKEGILSKAIPLE